MVTSTTKKNLSSSKNKQHTKKYKSQENIFNFAAKVFKKLEDDNKLDEQLYSDLYNSFKSILVYRKNDKSISKIDFKTIIDKDILNDIVAGQHYKYTIKTTTK